jgi:hypothetical protein
MIKIFTCNDVNPEFVELQAASFRKHLQEDFEFILFNGGETIGCYPDKAKEISRICRKLGVQVIDVQRDPAVEAVRNNRFAYDPEGRSPLFNEDGRYSRGVGGDSFNYMLSWAWANVISKEQGPICFVHSDVFLVEPLTLTDYLKEQDLCAIFTGKAPTEEHGSLAWIWEPLLLANMSKLPSPETIVWWPSIVEGEWADTGGQTYYWLKDNPDIKVLEIGQHGIEDDPALDFHPTRCQFFWLSHSRTADSSLGDKKIFHYQGGSRWCTDLQSYWNFTPTQSDEYHAKKIAWTRKLIGI